MGVGTRCPLFLAALLLQVASRGGGLRVLRMQQGLFPEGATFWGTKAGLLCGDKGPPSPASRRQPGPGPQWRTWVHTATCLGRLLTAPEGTVPGPTIILTTCLQLMLGLYRASGTLPGVSLPLPWTPPALGGSHTAICTTRLPDSNLLGAETALPSLCCTEKTDKQDRDWTGGRSSAERNSRSGGRTVPPPLSCPVCKEPGGPVPSRAHVVLPRGPRLCPQPLHQTCLARPAFCLWRKEKLH